MFLERTALWVVWLALFASLIDRLYPILERMGQSGMLSYKKNAVDIKTARKQREGQSLTYEYALL